MVSAGLASAAPSEAELAPYINAAVAEWERLTGFRPWLETGSASYFYDPPRVERRGFLDLATGFTAISAVAVGITPDDATGTVLTVSEDYVLRRFVENDSDTPYVAIQFLRGLSSRPQSIKVTGTKGYDDEIDDEVWLVVARQAATLAAEDLTQSGGDVDSIKQGQVTITYASVEEGGSVLSKWRKGFERKAAGFRRTVY